MRHYVLVLPCFLLCSALVTQTAAETGQVAASHPLAEQAGYKILDAGGNAIDAAVTAAFVSDVVEPYRCGIGGGAVILIWPAGDTQPVVIDALETAPQTVRTGGWQGWQRVGIPGTLAGLSTALMQYGTVPLEVAMTPALRYAQEGFTVDQHLYELIRRHGMFLSPEASRIFFRRRKPREVGQKLVQHDLAWSYQQIMHDGPTALYEGALARKILHAVPDSLITEQELRDYNPQMRRPIHTDYRGYDVLTAPPPCSSGMQLLQCLNMLEPFDTQLLGHNSPDYVHVLAEILRRSTFDRWLYGADQDDVPLEHLLSKQYAASEAMPIQLQRRSLWNTAPAYPSIRSENMVSAAVAASDNQGNMVVIAQTLHGLFGSGIMVPGTGILLNSAMSCFSDVSANLGSSGDKPEPSNRAAPSKRPSSALAPIIVLQNGKPLIAIADADELPNPAVSLQIILDCIDFGMPFERAITAPKIQFDTSADRLFVEWAMDVNIPILVGKGYTIQRLPHVGDPEGVEAQMSAAKMQVSR